jgi:D-alanyl-D-alanine carboxypeptidase/D-alanyl-D-alanine-endopeptidase (penicillin-binding protein 4)
MARRLFILVVALVAGCTGASGSTGAGPSQLPTVTARTTHPSATSVTPSAATPTFSPIDAAWVDAIDEAIADRDVSVVVGSGRSIVYRHRASTTRALASNEKLLTSMAALDLLGAGYRFRTRVATGAPVRDGVVDGDLWLIGGGDPTLTTADLAGLANDLADAGVRRITARVVGDTGAFDRGWWAPGWLRGISRNYVARPTALRLTGSSGLEAEAAGAFRAALLSAGIEVAGSSATGVAPDGLEGLATDRSAPLGSLLAHQNHESDNLYAELTTKLLGDTAATSGSTASGARVIQAWAAAHAVDASVRDGSGLSDQDRTSAEGLVTLLLAAQRRPWFPVFLRSLPTGGVGTLTGRLTGFPVHAKTGTLFVRPTSTLSGYVTTRNGRTVAFSVLTHDLPESTAVAIEDAVVRALAGATIRSP